MSVRAIKGPPHPRKSGEMLAPGRLGGHFPGQRKISAVRTSRHWAVGPVPQGRRAGFRQPGVRL
eukprot:10739537-Heterocapsa_arctica.AAC.1